MIQPFVDKFMAAKSDLIAEFKANRPDSYDDLVTRLVKLLRDEDEYSSPDPDRITVIDHGDYQGTRLFVIGATGYQPSTYWSIFVSYGSCSGCDTFEAIGGYSGYSEDPVTDTEANEYWTLMLHMVQSMRALNSDDE